jgi:hypothetical protein
MSLREQVARQAFVYGLPTVLLHGVLHRLVLDRERSGHPTFNTLSTGALPAGLGSIAGPVARGSSPFCGWIDLRSGPVLLTAPPDGLGSSVSATVLDLYAEEVGRLASGPAPAGSSLLLAGPSWEPLQPVDAAVHRCLTDLCLTVGQVVPADVDGPVRVLHPPLVVEPLEETSDRMPLADPVPPVDLRVPPTVAFLVALDWMLPLMPTPPGEDELRAELETIGLGGGSDALADALAEDRLDGQLTEGLRRGWELVRRGGPSESSRGRSAGRADDVARAVRVLAALFEETDEVDAGGAGRRAGRALTAGPRPGSPARSAPT